MRSDIFSRQQPSPFVYSIDIWPARKQKLTTRVSLSLPCRTLGHIITYTSLFWSFFAEEVFQLWQIELKNVFIKHVFFYHAEKPLPQIKPLSHMQICRWMSLRSPSIKQPRLFSEVGFFIMISRLKNKLIKRGFLSYGKTNTENKTASANSDEGALGLPLPSSLVCSWSRFFYYHKPP